MGIFHYFALDSIRTSQLRFVFLHAILQDPKSRSKQLELWRSVARERSFSKVTILRAEIFLVTARELPDFHRLHSSAQLS